MTNEHLEKFIQLLNNPVFFRKINSHCHARGIDLTPHDVQQLRINSSNAPASSNSQTKTDKFIHLLKTDGDFRRKINRHCKAQGFELTANDLSHLSGPSISELIKEFQKLKSPPLLKTIIVTAHPVTPHTPAWPEDVPRPPTFSA